MDNREALQRFEASLRRRFPKRRTPIDHVCDVRQFQKGCPKSWDTITVTDVDQFVDQMHQRGLKPATITRRVMALKVYFDCLANETADFEHPNPVRLKRHAAKLGRALPRDLSDAEVQRLWESLTSPRDRALVALLWHAGLRVSEVVGLTLADIPAREATQSPTSEPARLRVLGKGQKERFVYLNAAADTAVHTWLAARPTVSAPALFLNERGQPLSVNGVQWLLTQYGATLGLPLTPHRLRHTFARQMIEAQMPIESLASLMGHSQISTTQIYLSGADPAVRETFEHAMHQLETSLPQAELPATARAAMISAERVPPAEPHYPPLPDATTWATDLPDAIRQACLAHIQRLLPQWRACRRTPNALQARYQFAAFFRFVLTRRPTLTGVSELTPDDLRAYLDALQARELKASTLHSRVHHPLALLRALSEQGEPIAPGLLRLERPRLSDPLPRALSETDARRLEAQAQQGLLTDTVRTAGMVASYFLLAHTGMRKCELLDLRQADLDLVRRWVRIPATKNDRARVVYLTATAARAVQHFLELAPHPQHALLFANQNGDPLPASRLESGLRRLCHAAQVSPITPHRLRHTLATRLLNQGVPITTLQKLLGHRYLSATQIYARVYDATVERDYRQAMTRLEAQPGLAMPAEWFQGVETRSVSGALAESVATSG